MLTSPSFPRLAIVTALAVALTGCDRIQQYFNQPAQTPPVTTQQAGAPVGMLVADFSQLVEREGPAVVNITANNREEQDEENTSPFPFPIPEDDPFFEFFKRFMPPGQGGGRSAPSEREAMSYGSGFILSTDGFIMTNAHVVAGASQIQVKMADKREFSAKLIGMDKRTDVAVLKIEATQLPAVKIGQASQLKVGEWVAAIGAPFGFDNTVTAGIVSAKGRNLPDDTYVQFIQTDVAINPGNSGGPLFNLKGEVVGINSQIYSRSGGFMGISFSIPIDVAMQVAEQLKKNGKVSRGQLGVHIQELSLDLAQSFGRKTADGALVVNVEPNSPAAIAGLQIGDIVLTVDGEAVASSRDLPLLIGGRQPGTKVKLGLWRKGQTVEVEVTLAELKPDAAPTPSKEEPPKNNKTSFPSLGLTVAELSPAQRQQLALKGGVLVENVRGLAAKSGLMHGDIIIAVNQHEIVDAKSLEKLLNESGDSAALLVRRMDNTLFIPLRLKE